MYLYQVIDMGAFDGAGSDDTMFPEHCAVLGNSRKI